MILWDLSLQSIFWIRLGVVEAGTETTMGPRISNTTSKEMEQAVNIFTI